MEQNKTELLLGQIDKINEVISTLSENFSQEDVADEINFLSVVRDKFIAHNAWLLRDENGKRTLVRAFHSF